MQFKGIFLNNIDVRKDAKIHRLPWGGPDARGGTLYARVLHMLEILGYKNTI